MMTATRTAAKAFESLAEVRAFVARFEDASFTKSEWNHRAHLTVAAWYLLHHEEADATERVVSGILQFNRVNGIERTRTSGYHETLTLFWLAVVGGYLRTLPADVPMVEKINRLVATYADQLRLFLDHYTPERIWSWEARLAWMEPDLKPL